MNLAIDKRPNIMLIVANPCGNPHGFHRTRHLLSTDVIKNGNENYIGIVIMIKDLSLQTAIPKDAQKMFFDFVKVDPAKPIQERANVMFESQRGQEMA